MKALTTEEKQIAAQLKARLWLSISHLLESELSHLSQENPDPNSPPLIATPLFTAALVDLTYNQLINLGEDLESFARHAKRKTVTPEDLFMCCRRNGDLSGLLRKFWQGLNTDTKDIDSDSYNDNQETVVKEENKEGVIPREDNGNEDDIIQEDGTDDDGFGDSGDDEELLRIADRKR